MRNRVQWIVALTFLLIGGILSPGGFSENSRPNILWITCEDMSPNLGCYGDPVANTPNIDGLASQGLRYENAYSVSGVCAPSRSCLITGMYPTSIGTCHMRCKNQPPEPVKCFPEYLQAAGYYCTNNAKEDYNFDPPSSAWNESGNKAHFRNRPDKSQPFFAVFNFTITHESKIGTLPEGLSEGERKLLLEEKTDPQAVTLPVVYPDTPVIRKHWAHDYDLIAAMDRQVGKVLAELEEDGLTEDTIVFFYSDHGAGAPLFKRWMWDRGTRVPLIIKWPSEIEPGSATERLVSFVDFAPTVLSLAGVPIPEHMQGKAFLGKQAAPERDFIFSARDRMDERIETIRAVRDKRFRYIRNYRPEIPYNQYLNYPESFPIMQDLNRAYAAGELNEDQSRFFADRKPLEEFYDLESDPNELENLAASPARQEDLNRLRNALDAWMREVNDIGLIPEFQLAEWLSGGGRYPNPRKPYSKQDPHTPEIFGKSANDWIDQLNGEDRLERLEAAKVLGLIAPVVTEVLVQALEDPDPGVAYWAGVGLGIARSDSESILGALKAALAQEDWGRRLGAATGLVGLGQVEETFPTFEDAMRNDNEFVRLYAIQVLEKIGPTNPKCKDLLEEGLQDPSKYVIRCAHHGLGMPPFR